MHSRSHLFHEWSTHHFVFHDTGYVIATGREEGQSIQAIQPTLIGANSIQIYFNSITDQHKCLPMLHPGTNTSDPSSRRKETHSLPQLPQPHNLSKRIASFCPIRAAQSEITQLSCIIDSTKLGIRLREFLGMLTKRKPSHETSTYPNPGQSGRHLGNRVREIIRSRSRNAIGDYKPKLTVPLFCRPYPASSSEPQSPTYTLATCEPAYQMAATAYRSRPIIPFHQADSPQFH